MWGQWIGRIDGTNYGQVILNIDKDNQGFGRFLVTESSKEDPGYNYSFHAIAKISVEGNNFRGELYGFEIFTNENSLEVINELKKELPQKGKFKGRIDSEKLYGSWQTDIDTNGEFSLEKSENHVKYPACSIKSWNEFKSWAVDEKNKNEGLIFRGHEKNTYNLRTTFHRTNRRDLIRYSRNDVNLLAQYISANVGRNFSLENPIEYGELLGLAQHHGFPTPLLDWTESPFVAAFFAFHTIDKYSNKKEDYARIYCFDSGAWEYNNVRISNIGDTRLGMSRFVFNSRDNNRSIPQQSVVTFCTIYDVEDYIHYRESCSSEPVKYLAKIDISYEERDNVMKDLQIMGITAASLFPGLDGTCKALREKFF